jgi:prepilin-type N-terminal cleavage/methylation domain-containing protein
MKTLKYKTGLTLPEILTVIAIIVILSAIVLSLASRVDTQSNQQLTKGTMAILTSALEQFADYDYRCKDGTNYGLPAERDFYLGLRFPVDCNGFSAIQVADELHKVLGLNPSEMVSITPDNPYDPNYSGCEVMYFFLSQVPECRQILDRIDKSLLTAVNSSRQNMALTVAGKVYPLYRVVDSWGTPLRYDYYNERAADFILMGQSKRAFPLIISAGPDKVFGTDDDITSK